MDWTNRNSVERMIARLTREIVEIDRYVYRVDEIDDRVGFATMLQRKRDDVVRGTIIQIHTAIEDLLNEWIEKKLLGATKSKRRRGVAFSALDRLLRGGNGIGFDRKLDLALTLQLLDRKAVSTLRSLNSIRNKCSHHWLLSRADKRVSRVSRGGKRSFHPILEYKGLDVHNVSGLKEIYNDVIPIYLNMFNSI